MISARRLSMFLLTLVCSAAVWFCDAQLQIRGLITISTAEQMVYIGSSILAISGVSITGYIFLIESVRRLGETDPQKKSVADQLKSDIFDDLKIQFFITIILAVSAALLAADIPGNEYMAAVPVGVLTGVLIWAIYLDMEMMNFQNLLPSKAKGHLDEMRRELSRKRLVVRLDSQEYADLVGSKYGEGVNDFVEVYDYVDGTSGKGDVMSIRGMDDNYMYKADRKKGQREIVPWSVVGINNLISADFEVRDVLPIFEDMEKILCKITGVEGKVLTEVNRTKLVSSLNTGTSYRMEAGIIDDIDHWYFEIKRYRDYYMVAFENIEPAPDSKDIPDCLHLPVGDDECVGIINHEPEAPESSRRRTVTSDPMGLEYLRTVTPFVYLMRYELCKKLDNMDISGLSLSYFDFSYGNMRKSVLKDSVLMGCTFFATDLSNADISGCDLTDADFKMVNCNGLDLSRSTLDNIVFDECQMNGSQFIRTSLSRIVFPRLVMDGSTFEGASVFDTYFKNCKINNASFRDSKIISGRFADCLCADSDLRSVTISESTISGTDMHGGNLSGSMISTATIKNCNFIKAVFDSSIMTSNMVVNCDFSNTQCSGINFTGTQFLAVSFESSKLSGSNFTRVFVGSLGIRPRDSLWCSYDEAVRGDYLDIYEAANVVRTQNSESIGGEWEKAEASAMDKAVESASLMSGIKRNQSVFDHVEAVGCLFSEFEAANASMFGAILDRSVMIGMRTSCITLENSSMNGVTVMNSAFRDSNFRNASMEGASLTATTFANCVIRGASLPSAIFSNCTAVSCDFKDTSFEGVSLIDCEFRGVRGLDATLAKSNCSSLTLKGCYLSDDIGAGDVRLDGTFNNSEELARYLESRGVSL